MNLPTPCAEFEGRLPEYLDGLLPASEGPAVAAHLATCPACRSFADVWHHFDTALERSVRVPRLSAQFDVRLRRRIQAEAPLLSPGEREARKRACESEFSERTRAWRRRMLTVTTLLDGLGYWALASAFGLAAWQWLPKLTASSQFALPSDLPQGLVSGVLTGVVLLITVGLAFGRKTRRMRLAP